MEPIPASEAKRAVGNLGPGSGTGIHESHQGLYANRSFFKLADSGCPTLWGDGLLLAGLDVIGDYLTEVNVTSPTGFVEIASQSGFDVAARFAEALEQAARKD